MMTAEDCLNLAERFILGVLVPGGGAVWIVIDEHVRLMVIRRIASSDDWGMALFSTSMSTCGFFLTVASLIYVLQTHEALAAVKRTKTWGSLINTQVMAMLTWFGTAVLALVAWLIDGLDGFEDALLLTGMCALVYSARALLWYTALAARVAAADEDVG